MAMPLSLSPLAGDLHIEVINTQSFRASRYMEAVEQTLSLCGFKATRKPSVCTSELSRKPRLYNNNYLFASPRLQFTRPPAVCECA